MQVKSFIYTKKNGWSVDEFPRLDSSSTIVMIFGAPEYLENSEPIQELKRFYKKSIFAGCSTSGEIFGKSIYDNSLIVAVIKFEDTQVAMTVAPIKDQKESYDVGKQLGKKLSKKNLAAVIILSDGVNVNGTQLVTGIKDNVENHPVVFGGLAGDADRFEKTWVLVDGKPKLKYVSAIGLYGNNLEINCGSKGGWDIFGPERQVTKAKDNVLYEIDDQPALTLYKKYLGERAKGLPYTALLFPLAIRKSSDKKPIVRTILSINEKDHTMQFAGDIPEGWYAQLMRANTDRLVEGAALASKSAAENIKREDKNDTLVVAISCVGRRLVMGERAEEEVESLWEVLPKNANVIGFYAYGEISPSAKDEYDHDLHNQTMTLSIIREKDKNEKNT